MGKIDKLGHFGIELKKLQEAYAKFKKIPFPDCPNEDKLYDLYVEIVDFDSYIAGLISSYLKGGKINKTALYFDEKILENLKAFSSSNPKDKKEINLYINYMYELKNIIYMTKKIIDQFD